MSQEEIDNQEFLYRFIRQFVRTLAHAFFRDIEIVGESFVPDSGPAIVFSNHPNALIDGVLVLGFTPRAMRVVAKDTLFHIPLLRECLHAARAVPIRRKIDYMEEGARIDNSSAFEELFAALVEGGCIAIFPEGVSKNDAPHINALRTGAARVALGVAAHTKGAVRPVLVPCGLNYSDPRKFRSRALLNYGEQVVIDDALLELYSKEPMVAVRTLTDRMTESLKKVTINYSDWESQRVVSTLQTILRHKGRKHSFAEQVSLTKKFVDAIATAPEDVRSEVKLYQLWLEVSKLRDEVLRRDLGTFNTLLLLFARTTVLVLTSIIASPVLLFHLPIVLVASGVGQLATEKEVVGTLKLAVGGILTILLYTGVALFVGLKYGWKRAGAVLAVLPLTGAIALKVLDGAKSAARALPSLWRLLFIGKEAASIREVRSLLQQRAQQLLEQSNQSPAQQNGATASRKVSQLMSPREHIANRMRKLQSRL